MDVRGPTQPLALTELNDKPAGTFVKPDDGTGTYPTNLTSRVLLTERMPLSGYGRTDGARVWGTGRTDSGM